MRGRLAGTEARLKGEVRRKMNFTYVLGFVVLRDVVKVFPVSSSSFARKKTYLEESSTKSLGGMTRPKDEMGSQLSLPSPTYLIRYLFIKVRTTTPKLKLDASGSDSSGAWISSDFGSKWDPLTSAWRQGGASPERLAELSTGVSPLQKRIWKWDFYHCSSRNFFFHICFCHLWCELPLCKWCWCFAWSHMFWQTALQPPLSSDALFVKDRIPERDTEQKGLRNLRCSLHR